MHAEIMRTDLQVNCNAQPLRCIAQSHSPSPHPVRTDAVCKSNNLACRSQRLSLKHLTLLTDPWMYAYLPPANKAEPLLAQSTFSSSPKQRTC